MIPLTHTKPVDVFRDHAVDILNELSADREPYLITINGKVAAVLQDVESYEETQKNIAFVEATVLRLREIEEGKMIPMEEAFKQLRQRTAK